MKDARPNQAQTKARKLISVMPLSAPPMSRLSKFQLKLFIGGADQRKRKVSFMAFFVLIGLQNKI